MYAQANMSKKQFIFLHRKRFAGSLMLSRCLLEMVDSEFCPHFFEHLCFVLNSPCEYRDRFSFSVFEGYYNSSEAHEPFEEIARIDAAVIVLSAYLLARFGRAFLQVHIVRSYCHVIEETLKP